jgi:hypothetical protein
MSRLLERRPRLVEILSRSERIIYYGAAFALIVTVGMIFASAAISAVEALGAEPFLLIGLIAVVRRILLVTAEAEQTIGTEKFLNLVLELAVLTGLVIALSGALYFTRRAERPHSTESQGVQVPRSS